MNRILIVDDDEGLREIYKIILEKAGYEVYSCSDGRDILANNAPVPDIYLLDKQLCGTDGLDICRFLKSQASTRHIPVIIISASTDMQQPIKNAGADAFIEKPFEIKQLLETIARHISDHETV